MSLNTLTRIAIVTLTVPVAHGQTLRIDVGGHFSGPNVPFDSEVFPSINDGGVWGVSMVMDVIPTPDDYKFGVISHTGIVSSYSLFFNNDSFTVKSVDAPFSQINFYPDNSNSLTTISVIYQSTQLSLSTNLIIRSFSGDEGPVFFEDLADPNFDTSLFNCGLFFAHFPGGGFSADASYFDITIIPSPAPLTLLLFGGLVAVLRRR